MEYLEISGDPLKGHYKNLLIAFLKEEGLTYEVEPKHTYCLLSDSGEMVATGSIDDNVLKYIAISALHQGEGLTATLMTHLLTYAIKNTISHLFLYTKPKSVNFFSPFGFYKIQATNNVVLMENKRGGLTSFIKSVEKETESLINLKGLNKETIKSIGAIVVNCNPFTNGHRYLIETASKSCNLLHVFVVSSDKSVFPATVRKRLVEEGTKDISNVVIHSTGDYLVSPATFPTYFMKENEENLKFEASCELDIAIFLNYFAKTLNITKRFVGTEPFDVTTRSYNKQLSEKLPLGGVEFVEIERVKSAGEFISATRVRKLLSEGKVEEIISLVPPTTYSYLLSSECLALFN